MDKQWVEQLQRSFGGPRTDAEDALLEDMKGFIDFGIRNGLSFLSIMSTLGHDINGLYRYGFDYDAARKDAFHPKVTGYARISAEDVGEAEESAAHE